LWGCAWDGRAVISEDIVATTDGKVDLLIVTHEHWDHVSGFIQAGESFHDLTVGELWLAWTEDPNDALATKLRREREAALTALRLSASRLHFAGENDVADTIEGLIGFFGAAKGKSTKDALAAVRRKIGSPRYCRPSDKPVEASELGLRFYVLGPPHNEKLIRKTRPSKVDPETYGLNLALDNFQANVALALGISDTDATDGDDTPALDWPDRDAPFSTLHAIPEQVAREMDFFKRGYWGSEDWRRVDAAWLGGAEQLALQLDSATNNTSLVLAIELADGDVLLFVGDAQVGNWLSWQKLQWAVGSRIVTGPDLLKRTIFYKVGHHGSHNATLSKEGLEQMVALEVAMIPVDHAMAVKKRWGKIPLDTLVQELAVKAKLGVVRIDQPLPSGLVANVHAGGSLHSTNDLYYELTL
jgi:hypothetical protein